MANSNNDQIIKDIIDEVKDYANASITAMAQEVKEKLTKEAENAMIEFYKYSPKYYKRHGEKGGFLKYGFKPYYLNKHGTLAHGGVQIPGDLTARYRYAGYGDDDEEYGNDEVYHNIAQYVWAGFHGPVMGHNIPVTITTPSPFERVYQKAKELQDDQGVLARGFAKARRKNYNYIKFND